MKRGLWICLLLSLLVPGIQGEEGQEVEQSITDTWKETLLYGIEKEVLVVIGAIRESGEQSLNAELLSMLQESLSNKVRQTILEFFTEIEYETAKESALALLQGEESMDPELLIALLRYLSAIGTAAEADLVAGYIDHEKPGVAQAAITALGKIGDPETGSLLLERLGSADFSDDLRPSLVLALGELEYREAVEELIDIASDPFQDRPLRLYAASSLGKIGDERAIPVLKNMFAEQDSLVKMYAASALSSFDMKEVVDLLIQGLKDSNVRVRLTSAKALAHPDANKAVGILIYKAGKDPERQVRVEAIRALGAIGTGEALDFLRELYSDRFLNPVYREAALSTLVEHDLGATIGTIEQVLERELGVDSRKGAELTAKVIARSRHEGLKNIYLMMLQSADPVLRVNAIRGIANNQFRDLKGRIEELAADDPNPSVKKVALWALQKL